MRSDLTYGEVDGFVAMLQVACEDAGINESLELLLSQPDARRRAVIRDFLDRFRTTAAPKSLHDAFACLLDDRVAEKAYEVIFKCRKG